MTITTIRRALGLALLAPLFSACGPDGALDRISPRGDIEIFSVRHDPPRGRQWVVCPTGGRDEGRMSTIGPTGDRITLRNGHVLTVTDGAVSDSTDFVFVEPRSPQIVVYASAPGRFTGDGVGLTLSWANRPGCDATGAVIARIVPGDSAQEIRSRPGARANTIETAVPLTSLSAYALAR